MNRMVTSLRQITTRSIALLVILPITGVAPRAVHSFADEGHNSATGLAPGDSPPGTQRSCEPACAPGDSRADTLASHPPPTIHDNILPIGAVSPYPSNTDDVRHAMEQLSEMAQYFLTENSPDHADVDFAIALPAGDCVARLSYSSANDGQAIHINLIIHDDVATTSHAGPAVVLDLPTTRMTELPSSTTNVITSTVPPFSSTSLTITSLPHASFPLTGALELTKTSQPTMMPHPEDPDFVPPPPPPISGGGPTPELWLPLKLAAAMLAVAVIVVAVPLGVIRCRRDRAKRARIALPYFRIDPYLQKPRPDMIRHVSRRSSHDCDFDTSIPCVESRHTGEDILPQSSSTEVPSPAPCHMVGHSSGSSPSPAMDAPQAGCSLDVAGYTDAPPRYEVK